MAKVCVVLAGLLICPLVPSARACCGPAPVVPAGPALKKETGPIKKTVRVEINGKMQFVRCYLFGGRSNAYIRVDGVEYWLDFRHDKKLLAQVGDLADKTVHIEGELEVTLDEMRFEDGIGLGLALTNLVKVKSIRAGEGESVKKTVEVELHGKLQEDLREILRPLGVSWYVTVEGQRYYLDLSGRKGLGDVAATLDGKVAKVGGTLETHGRWLIVRVKWMESPELLGCGLPPLVEVGR